MNLKCLAMLLPALAAGSALAAGVPVRIAPGSLEVTVAVRATMHSFEVRITDCSLAATVDPATGAFESAEFAFAWSGARTANDKRDRELLEWVHAEAHPAGTFKLAKIERRGEESFATGTLEFFGNSRTIEFPVGIETAGSGLRVSGEAVIDHRDWGLKQFRKLGLLSVNPTVTVRFAFETAGPA